MSTPRAYRGPVERGWDQTARGYDAYFGPRFAPYLGAALGALAAHSAQHGLPEGAVLAPCVGPGRELPPLARELEYADAPSLWQALTHLGPLRTLANARGPELIAALRAQFALELQDSPTPLTHTPEARLLLIERRATE
ncbi:MAG: hypothetical protein ABI488_18070 [Polyangiaceae bacterium]